MSTIKVDTVTTLDGTGNITLSRPLTGLSGSGASLTALNATQLTSGTLPDARFPATLPAASGVNLTALNGTQVTSGTIPDARFPATLPAASGVNLTALNATQLTSGTLPIARIADDAVTTAKIASDAITAAKIADDVINSEHYVAGSIDLEHMSSQSVDEDNLHISNAGTNGQFLSKQSGNSGGLTWADAGGGSWEYVSTSTSGTARDFNNVFSWSTYPAYLFVMDMAMDNSGGGLGARFYNSSNTLVTSGYQWNYAVLNSNASTWSISNNNSDSWMKFSNYPCNAIPLWCSLLVRQANGRQSIQADCTWVHTQGSSYHGRSVAGGLLFNSDTCSGIHIKQWSGVFQGGNIHMYRLKKT